MYVQVNDVSSTIKNHRYNDKKNQEIGRTYM